MRYLVLFLLCASRLLATAYWFDEAPFTTYGEFNPAPLNTSTLSGHTVKQLHASGSLRFWSRSASVGIHSYTSTAAGRTYVLLQDGTQVGSVAIPATGGGSYSTYTLATGLDTTAAHFYEIVCITPIRGGVGSWYDAYLELDSLESVVVPTRPIFVFYGDSITAVGSATPAITDTRLADMWQACYVTGKSFNIAAVGGGKVNPTGRDGTATIATNCDQVHVRYGVNDLPDLPGASASFQTAYSDMVDNIRTRIGAGKPIYCYQPQPVAAGSQRALAGTLIQAAISGKSDVYYVNTDNWYPTTTTYLPDGTHPNALCYSVYANREVPIFSTAAVVVAGPTTGNSNYASSTFTVTLANGATFTGDQLVTVTASDGTIAATAAGGSITGNGTSAPVVTPANGVTSFTFVYTPNTINASTLTPTSAQDKWPMPSASAFTALSVLPGRPRGSITVSF